MLPELEEEHAYLLMLICRSRFMKQMRGAKIRDTVLEKSVIIWGEKWRDALFRRIKRFSILAENADKLYVVKSNYVPPSATGIMIVLNQARIKNAVVDFLNEVTKIVILENRLEAIGRLENIWFGSLHKRTKKRFHVLDVDTMDAEILSEIEAILEKYGGWWAKIETFRGVHYILDLTAIDVRRFFPEFVRKEYPKLQEKYRDEEGKPLIEYKKEALEPVPGTMYGGKLIRLL